MARQPPLTATRWAVMGTMVILVTGCSPQPTALETAWSKHLAGQPLTPTTIRIQACLPGLTALSARRIR